jgi:hypothetical protein
VECTAPLTAPEPAEVVPAAASARPTASAPEAAAPEPPAPRRAGPEAPARPPRAETPPARQPPPARTAPPQAPPAEVAGGSGRSLAELKAEWNRLLKTLRDQDKPTEALLRSCTLVGLDGSLLRLSTSDFIYNRMQSDADTRGRVDALVSQVFGQGVVVRYEVAGKRGADRRNDDIPQDGLVATALDLGGEIVE